MTEYDNFFIELVDRLTYLCYRIGEMLRAFQPVLELFVFE